MGEVYRAKDTSLNREVAIKVLPESVTDDPERLARYQARRSIVLTTNLAFKDWNTIFPNASCIATLLDRLTHHADVTLVEGKSYRVRESEKENAERKKRRKKKTPV